MKMLYYYLASFGTLAQLAEQLTLNQWVKGSNPLGSTILLLELRWLYH